MLAGLTSPAGHALSPADTGQGPQVIEMTAKRYDFEPSPIRVKQGSKVQLKITTADREHGVKFNLYPDGAKETGSPGLIFASPQDCYKVQTGSATIVEFTAQTPGTYSFKCCVSCGMGHGRMKGKVIVEP
jgi:cytochrome c oxidase subunit 2